MAACSILPDGTLVRWHYADLDECAEPKCQRRHATKAELDTFEEEAIAFRAGAMCAASEPHGVVGDDWPCPACLARVRTASAPASSLVVSGSAATGTGFDGGPDRAPVPPSGQGGTSTSAESNRRERELPAAEGATAIARTEGTR